MYHLRTSSARSADKDWKWGAASVMVDESVQDDEGMREKWFSDRIRCSTREDGPDGPGWMQAHQHSRSLLEANFTCVNRCFRLRGDHRLQTKEQALRLFLSPTWSMVRSISSCGNLDMMVVAIQQALLVLIASVEDIFEPHVGASETAIRFISSDARSSEPTYLYLAYPNPSESKRRRSVLRTQLSRFPSDLWYLTWPRMEYPVPISPFEWWEV